MIDILQNHYWSLYFLASWAVTWGFLCRSGKTLVSIK